MWAKWVHHPGFPRKGGEIRVGNTTPTFWGGPRGAACSNSRPQLGAKTFRGLGGGGGGVVGSAGQPPGSLEGAQWAPQHTYLNMIPMTG